MLTITIQSDKPDERNVYTQEIKKLIIKKRKKDYENPPYIQTMLVEHKRRVRGVNPGVDVLIIEKVGK